MGAGGLGGQSPIRLAAGRSPSAADPLRVLLVGDSVMYTEAPAVAASLGSTGKVTVTDGSFPGWGLTTDPGWPADVTGVIDRTRPELVVAMWSWDDDMALAHPAQYRSLLGRFTDTVLANGNGVAGLVFLQFPKLGPVVTFTDPAQDAATTAHRTKGVQAWNRLVAGLPGAFPGKVMYLPVGAAVETDGHYASWLPPEGRPDAPAARWLRVRMVDDVHFCPAGAARYAAAVQADLASVLKLGPVTDTWADGTWRGADRFAHKPGLSVPCPDDHPSAGSAAFASG
jgi:hypothetical protein